MFNDGESFGVVLFIELNLACARISYVTCDPSPVSLRPVLPILLRLDSIGIGGFSHDFGSLTGKSSPIIAAFDSFGTVKPSFSIMLSFLVGVIFPQLSSWMPTSRKDSLKKLGNNTRGIAAELLYKAAKEKADVDVGGQVDKSILGALGEEFSFFADGGLLRLNNNPFYYLVRSMNGSSKVRMSVDEVMSQVRSRFEHPSNFRPRSMAFSLDSKEFLRARDKIK